MVKSPFVAKFGWRVAQPQCEVISAAALSQHWRGFPNRAPMLQAPPCSFRIMRADGADSGRIPDRKRRAKSESFAPTAFVM